MEKENIQRKLAVMLNSAIALRIIKLRGVFVLSLALRNQ